jgi:hypothetical protein
MGTYRRIEHPKFQAYDSDGDPLSGGLLYTYEPGTSTPKATYQEDDTLNANPVVLDSLGQAEVYGTGFYKFVLKTSAGVTVWTLDNIQGIGETSITDIGDYAGDFDAAITAIGATATTLYIDSTATMSAGVTVPATCTVVLQKGGVIDQAANALTFNGALIVQGGTITNDAALAINGPFQSYGSDQIFTDTSTVSFAAGSTDRVVVDWWGTNAAALTEAIDAVGTTKIPIHFMAGTYTLTGFDTQVDNEIVIEGEGMDATILSGGTQFSFTKAFTIRDLRMTAWVHAANDGALYLDDTIVANIGRITIERVKFDTMDGAFRCPGTLTAYEVEYLTVKDCHFKSIDLDAIRVRMRIQGADISHNYFNTIGDGSSSAFGILLGEGSIIDNSQQMNIHHNHFKTVTGATATDTHAIIIYGHYSVIEGNTIDTISGSGADHEAIYTKGSYITISNNVVKDGGDGGSGYITMKGATDSGHNIISGNVIVGATCSEAIYTNSGCTIVGNTIHITTTGGGIRGIASATDYKFNVSDNKIVLAAGAGNGIHLTDIKNSVISGNSILTTDGEGINIVKSALAQGAENLTITGNTIIAAGTGRYAIDLADTEINVIITGNYLEGATTATVVNWNDSTGVCKDNIGDISAKIPALADEATPTVAHGEVFITGGTTTITDFDDGVFGKTITIIAEHSLTITDGTNIFLSGSANWAMTATDTLTLIQKVDGKWYEISRSDSGA